MGKNCLICQRKILLGNSSEIRRRSGKWMQWENVHFQKWQAPDLKKKHCLWTHRNTDFIVRAKHFSFIISIVLKETDVIQFEFQTNPIEV